MKPFDSVSLDAVSIFIKHLQHYVLLGATTEKSVREVSQVMQFPKGHLLLREGIVAQRLFFIVMGSARTFYYHAGKDITSWIYPEQQFLTAWNSFFQRTPAYEYLELTEAATVVSLTYDQLQQLYQQHPKMQLFGRLLAEQQLAFLDQFYKGFMFMTAKEKYDLLLDHFPDVTQRVNVGHIASFLGISQETLSRIRRKM